MKKFIAAKLPIDKSNVESFIANKDDFFNDDDIYDSPAHGVSILIHSVKIDRDQVSGEFNYCIGGEQFEFYFCFGIKKALLIVGHPSDYELEYEVYDFIMTFFTNIIENEMEDYSVTYKYIKKKKSAQDPKNKLSEIFSIEITSSVIFWKKILDLFASRL